MIGNRARRAMLVAGVPIALALLLWGAGAPGQAGTWGEVRRDDLVLTVDVTGTLEAVRASLLGPPVVFRTWNYQIAFLSPEGAEVEAGTPVLGFDASELERTLQEMLAERDKAEKEIEKLSADLEVRRREQELALAEAEGRLRVAALKLERPPPIVAEIELELARLDLELADRERAFHARRLDLLAEEERTSLAALRESRDRAAARVVEIEEQIRKMTVTAPEAGTVIYVADHQGKKPKVGESVWRGAAVLEIPDLSLMRAAGEVAEIAAARLAPDQPVSLRLDAHPDVVYKGRVDAIERAVRRRSESDPTRVFRLKVELEESDSERMRPGMRYSGEIEVTRINDILTVPAAAVFPSPDGPLVYRRTWGGLREVRPELGRRSAKAIEVLAGLEAGDQVALVRPRKAGR